MSLTEYELVRKASKGDSSAFEKLMQEQEKKMYSLALFMCDNNYADAQDCVQDAMLRIFRSIGGFKGDASFSTWVYRITVNSCRDFHRRNKSWRTNTTSLDVMTENGFSPEDDRMQPEEEILMDELSTDVRDAIVKLPRDMKEAVILRDIHGFAYEDIASMLQTNVGTIKSRISRGREKLRKEIDSARGAVQ